MKHKIFITLFLLFAAGSATAQNTRLKTNALYWAGLVPNVSVETRLAPKWTLNGDFVISFWESVKGRPLKGLQAIAEGRFYVKEAFEGFYVGGYAGYDSYTVSKWDHPKHEVQHGIGIALGITLGYQIEIGGRWGMDFYLAGGWHHGWYYGEDRQTGGRYAEWNKSGEWIPYKAGVAFTYKLGKGKQNGY